jgi:hypothetical protein
MIKQLTFLLLAAGTLAACSSAGDNPPQLWLAPDQDELHAKLIDSEPSSY